MGRAKLGTESAGLDDSDSIFRAEHFTADDAPLLANARSFRARVYSEDGLFDEAGSDVDPYDDYCDHIGVFDGSNEMVAYTRIIPRRPGAPLPAEIEPFWLPLDDQRSAVELSRLVVDSRVRSKGLHQLLWREAYQRLAAQKIDDCWAIVEDFLFQAFQSVGLPFKFIAGPHDVYNAPNVAIVLALDEVIPAMARVTPELAFFMASESGPLFHPSELKASRESVEAFEVGLAAGLVASRAAAG